MSAHLTMAFADSIDQSQASFRALLDAMSRPGTIREIAGADRLAGVPGLSPAAAAVALTLVDFETPVWLSPAASPCGEWLRFHCGARIVADPGAARFAFAGAAETLPDLEAFDLGSDEFPDRAVTLVLDVTSLRGTGWRLSGPGINGMAEFSAEGVSPAFLAARRSLAVLFPRGLDVIFAAGAQLAALPRTTKVEG
jgi:alpha-D-ribose 1-methylphosphonate 5-triphosphate synthase subunit PhnH